MGKFSRTWQLMGASWRLLKQDKRLVVYPLLSGLVLALVIASFAVPIFATGAQTYLNAAKQHNANFYVGLFLFYFVNYLVLIFFNSALIACVLRQMEGGEPGLGYGLHFAWQRLPQIFGWALLTSSVGFILRLIEERVELLILGKVLLVRKLIEPEIQNLLGLHAASANPVIAITFQSFVTVIQRFVFTRNDSAISWLSKPSGALPSVA